MSWFDWLDDLFSPSEQGGAGGGTAGQYALSKWAAQVPHIGPYLGMYLTGREDLSGLTNNLYEMGDGWGDGPAGQARSPDAPLGQPADDWVQDRTGLIQIASDFDVSSSSGARSSYDNPNLMADNSTPKVSDESWMDYRPEQLGPVRPELQMDFDTRPPPRTEATSIVLGPPDEVTVHGERPDRSSPLPGVWTGSVGRAPGTQWGGAFSQRPLVSNKSRPFEVTRPQMAQAEEHSELWKWMYRESGVWFYDPREGDFWPQSSSFNTGSILENVALNFWAGLGNLIGFAANRRMEGWGVNPLLHEVRKKIGLTDADMEAFASLPVMGFLREEALAEGARPFMNQFSTWERFRAAFAADRAIPPIDPRVMRPVGKTAEMVADARASVRGYNVWPSQFPNNQGLDRVYVKAGQTAQSMTRPKVTEVKYHEGYRPGQLEVALKQLKRFGSYQSGVTQGSWRNTYLRSGNLVAWPSATPEMQETGWLLQQNLMNIERTLVIVNEWLELEEFDLGFWGMYDDMF